MCVDASFAAEVYPQWSGSRAALPGCRTKGEPSLSALAIVVEDGSGGCRAVPEGVGRVKRFVGVRNHLSKSEPLARSLSRHSNGVQRLHDRIA